jgi:hypothetical protein
VLRDLEEPRASQYGIGRTFLVNPLPNSFYFLSNDVAHTVPVDALFNVL